MSESQTPRDIPHPKIDSQRLPPVIPKKEAATQKDFDLGNILTSSLYGLGFGETQTIEIGKPLSELGTFSLLAQASVGKMEFDRTKEGKTKEIQLSPPLKIKKAGEEIQISKITAFNNGQFETDQGEMPAGEILTAQLASIAANQAVFDSLPTPVKNLITSFLQGGEPETTSLQEVIDQTGLLSAQAMAEFLKQNKMDGVDKLIVDLQKRLIVDKDLLPQILQLGYSKIVTKLQSGEFDPEAKRWLEQNLDKIKQIDETSKSFFEAIQDGEIAPSQVGQLNRALQENNLEKATEILLGNQKEADSPEKRSERGKLKNLLKQKILPGAGIGGIALACMMFVAFKKESGAPPPG